VNAETQMNEPERGGLLAQALERARLIESDPEADDLTRAEILALADAVERARLVHAAVYGMCTDYTNGMRNGVQVVLGLTEMPPEWRSR
jgi:hypothetical protein